MGTHLISADTETGYPPGRVAWTAVGVLLVLYGVAFLDRQIISLVVGDLRHELGVSDFQVSLLQGFAFALLYALFGLPIGMAVDRWSRRWVIFTGVLIWSIAAMLCGLARTFPQLLAARALVGAGEAALAPAAYSLLSDLFPKRRLTTAVGIFATGSILGSEASLAISGLILSAAKEGVDAPFIGHLTAWRFAFIAAGAPGVLLAFAIFLIPEPLRRGSLGAVAAWVDVLRFIRANGRFFACHFVGFGCMMALGYARISWTPALLIRRFGWDVARVGVTLGAFGAVSGAAAFLLTGLLVDRLFARGRRDAHLRVYVAGSLITLVFGVAAFLAPSPPLLFLFLTIIAFPINMGAIAASALQVVTPARLRGRVSAIYLMVTALFGMTVGPGLVGFFTDAVFHDPAKLYLSLSAVFAILSPLGLIAFTLGLAPMRRAVDAAGAD
jgi:MFS family permease